MELFESFLKLGPLLLLKVVAKQTFGPWGASDDGQWRFTSMWTVLVVLSVLVGGVVSMLVLSEVLPVSPATKGVVVIAGCLSLLLLAVHMLWGLAAMYRSDRRSR